MYMYLTHQNVIYISYSTTAIIIIKYKIFLKYRLCWTMGSIPPHTPYTTRNKECLNGLNGIDIVLVNSVIVERDKIEWIKVHRISNHTLSTLYTCLNNLYIIFSVLLDIVYGNAKLLLRLIEQGKKNHMCRVHNE